MKILLLDIETAPNLAYVWGLFKQNIATNQVEASSYVLCWAAKWLGTKRIQWQSIRQPGGEREMLQKMRDLLDKADVVVHYNGTKFDVPTLNKEMVKLGIPPPAPFKSLDLMLVCKQVFRFESNRLEYVARALGLGTKIKHPGFSLWTGCMRGDRESWRLMRRYNMGDVALLERLYPRLQPWIKGHPNHSTFQEAQVCPKCGSTRVQRRGEAVTSTKHYARFQCQDCGGWSRGTKTLSPRGERLANIL